ncbi:MAG: class II glutamine amidotransferase, partial [Coxiellaceae bacterium]|nr:class II glutamine amidotransferase [Coxiellaceae bacterium]
GETDSEHFFSLFHNILHTEYESATLENMKSALLKAIKTISDMQNDIGKGDYSLLNTVITDGEQLIATRYTTANAEKQESLYYTFGEHILPQIGNGLMQPVESGKVGAVLIASEPINEKNEEWIEVPRNHIVIVNKDLEITVEPIKI